MKIGLVIHNLQLMDSCQAIKDIFTLLSRENRIDARLCGTMGKIAVVDAGLEGLIDINQTLKPSSCIETLFRTNDLVCLLNHGKELKTGRTFGRIVVSHLENPEEKPLIQIERPDRPDGELIPWNRAACPHAEKLSGLLNLKISRPPSPINTIEVTNEGRHVRRRISTRPGAYIMVNGIVVGKAASPDVALIAENGFLTSMEGGVLKEQGLEILHRHEERIPVDLAEAWIKTGTSRREQGSSRCLVDGKNGNSTEKPQLKKRPLQGELPEHEARVVLIDHCAERSLEMMEGAGLAVTVGDDTTEIAGDILSRFSIPILGIMDGDCDELAASPTYFPGSLILRLKPGSDDEFGRKVKQELFSGKQAAFFENIETLRQTIIKLAGNSLESISEY